jgi:predicted HTH domain antitoxin
MTRTLTIEYDDELLALLKLSPEEFDRQARFLLFAKLFELGMISSGKAARQCGMGRVDFLMKLGEAGVSAINLTPEELEEDLKFGRGE